MPSGYESPRLNGPERRTDAQPYADFGQGHRSATGYRRVYEFCPAKTQELFCAFSIPSPPLPPLRAAFRLENIPRLLWQEIRTNNQRGINRARYSCSDEFQPVNLKNWLREGHRKADDWIEELPVNESRRSEGWRRKTGLV